MSKKSQSLLVSAVIHFISIMLFFVILFTLITSYYHVRFVINDFDARTSSLTAIRRMVSSTDCLAHEERTIFRGNNGLVYGSRVYPGILDISKFSSLYNLNCMRKDAYDLMQDIHNGVWDASQGKGKAAKYDLIALISDGEEIHWIFNPTESDNTPNKHEYTSLIGRVDKLVNPCNIVNCPDYCDCSDSSCGLGVSCNRCVSPGLAKQLVGDFFGDINSYVLGSVNAIAGTNLGIDFGWNPSCSQYGNGAQCSASGGTNGICLADGKYKPLYYPRGYSFKDVYNFSIAGGNVEASTFKQEEFTCNTSGSNETYIYPSPFYYIDTNGELHSGLLIFRYCEVQGSNYVGLELPEVELKWRFNK